MPNINKFILNDKINKAIFFNIIIVLVLINII